MAKLIFRYGSMNSGKTTILIQTDYNYKERGMKTIILKPKTDTKGDKHIVSRIGATREVDIIIDDSFNINTFITKIKEENIAAVLIDEAQFLKEENVNDFYYIAKKIGVPVLCYGLRVDFMSNAFEGSARLLALADELIEMPTICECGKKARLVGRKVNNEFVFEGEQVVIDGTDSVEYISMCGNCYIDEKEQVKIKNKKGNRI